ncbi:hypothetical protein [Halomonas alkalisoli]|uniref:hypothetical protein n=1 Tax=Halomonas alkalisoli TaxID=2907158 RepID=UPI001F222E87|nr:hypothetical protein [Halomonas alkalisoli]MCE9683355.1 hypothetical protein [Halomonas alkalisoli]
MNSTNLIKKLGILGITMGLVSSPLAFSDQPTLPTVIVTAQELVSPSMRSDPVNDPRDKMQAAFRGHVTPNGTFAELSPSFRSQPVTDPRDRTQPAFQGYPISTPAALISPSFRSDPINDPFRRESLSNGALGE